MAKPKTNSPSPAPEAEVKTKSDVTKQLEAALGEKIAVNPAQRFNLWSAVASYNFTFSDSYTTWVNLILALPKICNSTSLLDVSGFAASGTDGTRVFRLKDFVCLGDSGYSLGPPINVVATPVSTDPVFLTVTHVFINNATDVEIRVSTWDANGVAAPSVAFDWRCRVAYFPVIPLHQPGTSPVES